MNINEISRKKQSVTTNFKSKTNVDISNQKTSVFITEQQIRAKFHFEEIYTYFSSPKLKPN